MKRLITTICLLAVTTAIVVSEECQAGSRKQRNGLGNFQRQRSSGNGRSRFGNTRNRNQSTGKQSFRQGQNKKTQLTKNFSNGGQNRDRHNFGFRNSGNRNLLRKFRKDDRGSRTLRRVLGHHGSQGHNHAHSNRPWFRSQRRHQHANHWCFKRPTYCHWWFDYCTPLAQCHSTDIVHCDFVRCEVPYVVLAQSPVANDVTWYLGIKGMILPQAGLGIDEVEAGSPAAQAGLTAGMVIISCNDIEITNESDMQKAISTSGGTLRMVVQLEDGSQAQGVVQMVQAPVAGV